MKTFPPIKVLILLLLCFFSCKNSTIKSNETSFAISDTTIVDSVCITNENQTVVLVKKDDSWIVNNKFVAESPVVSRLLNTLLLLKLKSPLPENSIEIVKNELKNDIFVQVFSNKKELKAFYLGKYTAGSGNYILLKDAEAPYLVYIPSFDFDLRKNFETDLKKWQSKILFSFDPDNIFQIELINFVKNKGFILSKINENYKIVDVSTKNEISTPKNENIDFYLTRFQNVMIDNIFENVDKKVIDSLLAEKPVFSINIIDVNGDSVNLKAYNFVVNNKTDKNKFLGLVDNYQLVIAKYYDFDLLLKDFEYFTKEN